MLLNSTVWPDIYKYVDENGTIVFTDDASKLPTNRAEQRESSSASDANGNRVEKYLSDLKSPDISMRETAAREFAKQHHIAGVRAALRDIDGKVRHAAILNLSIMLVDGKGRRDPEAVAMFVDGLKDNDADVRLTALRKLEDYSNEAYFQQTDMDPDICLRIAELLDEPKENLRWQAIGMLENCRVKSVENKLLHIANNNKESVKIREGAIRNLAKSKITGLDEKLLKFLHDESEDKEIVRVAIYSLGKLKSFKAVDRIIKYTADKDQQVHYAAVIALSNIGAPKAANALVDVLIDNKGQIDLVTLESLGKVSSPSILHKLLKVKPLLAGSNSKMKFAEALGATGSDNAVSPLLEFMLDKDVAVQSSASKTIDTFDSPVALKSIIEASKKDPGNQQLSYLAKKAQRKLDFPEEALREKEKQKEESFVFEQEQEINKIYNTGYRLFREKKYDRALPYFYEAVDKFEKLYVTYPAGFKSSYNQIRQIRSLLAGYYRWKVKNSEKAINEYTKLVSVLKKYDVDKRATIPYWFMLAEIYEKDVKNYQIAQDCYKTILALSVRNEKQDRDMEIFGKWYVGWISFLQEKINVMYLKKQASFTHRSLKYPNIEYTYFFALGGQIPAFSQGNFVDEDFLNYGSEYLRIEELDKLYTKYPDSYQVMFFGIALFHQFLKDNMTDKALLVSEKLTTYYPYDLNILMLQSEAADIYKTQSNTQKYKEAIDKCLKTAKTMNIDIVLGSDSRFSMPEKTWQLFVESLKKGDINAAVECFSPTSQQKFREIFMQLKGKLNEIASDMGPIRMIKKEESRAEYDILRTENGKRYSYGLYFVNVLGEWKIEQF